MQNPCYPAVPPMRMIATEEVPELGIRHGWGIYEMVFRREDLSCLDYPEKIPTISAKRRSMDSFRCCRKRAAMLERHFSLFLGLGAVVLFVWNRCTHRDMEF